MTQRDESSREIPQPSEERSGGIAAGRADPCKGVATPSQTGTDRPPVMGMLAEGWATDGDWLGA